MIERLRHSRNCGHSIPSRSMMWHLVRTGDCLQQRAAAMRLSACGEQNPRPPSRSHLRRARLLSPQIRTCSGRRSKMLSITTLKSRLMLISSRLYNRQPCQKPSSASPQKSNVLNTGGVCAREDLEEPAIGRNPSHFIRGLDHRQPVPFR